MLLLPHLQMHLMILQEPKQLEVWERLHVLSRRHAYHQNQEHELGLHYKKQHLGLKTVMKNSIE